MPEDARGGEQARIAAAYDVFAQEPRRASLQVTAAARAVGASRTQFYQHWETATALGEDVGICRATSDASWQATVMADDGDVFRAIAVALQAPTAPTGVTARAVLAAEPVGSQGHAGVQAWESRWLRWLADRLRIEHDNRPGVPWTTAAAMVTALVEGTLLVRGPRLGGSIAPFDAAFSGLLATVAADATTHLVEHIAGPDLALDGDGDGDEQDSSTPVGARRLLERVVEAIETGALPVGHSDDVRVVSPKLLARELNVSTRWVFGCWPTAADFNAALFGESLRRLGVVTEAAAMRAFADASISHPDQVTPLLVRINEQLLDVDDLPEPLVQLSLMDLLDHADVGGRHTEVIQRWCTENQMRAAAILQATNRRLAPHVGIAEFTDLAVGAGVGGWRVCAAHRDLLDQRCTYLGQEFVAMAAGLDTITQACVLPTADG